VACKGRTTTSLLPLHACPTHHHTLRTPQHTLRHSTPPATSRTVAHSFTPCVHSTDTVHCRGACCPHIPSHFLACCASFRRDGRADIPPPAFFRLMRLINAPHPAFCLPAITCLLTCLSHTLPTIIGLLILPLMLFIPYWLRHAARGARHPSFKRRHGSGGRRVDVHDKTTWTRIVVWRRTSMTYGLFAKLAERRRQRGSATTSWHYGSRSHALAPQAPGYRQRRDIPRLPASGSLRHLLSGSHPSSTSTGFSYFSACWYCRKGSREGRNDGRVEDDRREQHVAVSYGSV